jgi:hypothetical protein
MDRKVRLLVERRRPPLIDPPIKLASWRSHGQGSQDATCDDPLREAWCELLDPGPRQVNECMPRTPIGYVADRMTSGT